MLQPNLSLRLALVWPLATSASSFTSFNLLALIFRGGFKEIHTKVPSQKSAPTGGMPKSLLSSWSSQLEKTRKRNEKHFCQGWSFCGSVNSRKHWVSDPFLKAVQQWIWARRENGPKGNRHGKQTLGHWLQAQDPALALYLLSDCHYPVTFSWAIMAGIRQGLCTPFDVLKESMLSLQVSQLLGWLKHLLWDIMLKLNSGKAIAMGSRGSEEGRELLISNRQERGG